MDNMYTLIEQLCQEKGTNITAMCRELAISRSVLSELKSGRTQVLSATNTEKIARYFGVSVGYLLGEADRPDNEEDEEIREYLEQLKTRSEMRMLFRMTKDATKEDIEKVVRVFEAFQQQ